MNQGRAPLTAGPPADGFIIKKPRTQGLARGSYYNRNVRGTASDHLYVRAEAEHPPALVDKELKTVEQVILTPFG